MKNQAKTLLTGIVLGVCGILAAGAARNEYKPYPNDNMVQMRTYTKHLITDKEGRLLVVDVYTGIARYVELDSGSVPNHAVVVK